MGGYGDHGYDAEDVGAEGGFYELVADCEGEAAACGGAGGEEFGLVAAEFISIAPSLQKSVSIINIIPNFTSKIKRGWEGREENDQPI
jgi:hypothetical protein